MRRRLKSFVRALIPLAGLAACGTAEPTPTPAPTPDVAVQVHAVPDQPDPPDSVAPTDTAVEPAADTAVAPAEAVVEPSAEECAPKLAAARKAAKAGKADAAFAGLDELLTMGGKACRLAADGALVDPAFDKLRKDERMAKLAAGFVVDPAKSLSLQLCADPGRLATLIDARGVHWFVETEATPDGAPAGHKKGVAKAADALARLVGFVDSYLWCYADEGATPGTKDCMGGSDVEDPLLADTKDDLWCAHRDECNEWAEQGDLCLARTDAGWRAAFFDRYPTGPIGPEYVEEVQKRAAVVRAAAAKAYHR
ncbi:MAG: hypothetical protein U1F43_09950 [Myxococcota bacterium]